MINFFNLNKKKIIIGTLVTMVVAIWIAGYFIIPQKEKGPIPSPSPTPTSKPFMIPQSAKLEVGGVEVNNYYKNSILTGKDGYSLFYKTAKYKIAYIPVDQSFLISILDNPFESVRKEAEQAFLKQLGISQNDACFLKVNIATNMRINPAYAGKNYPLSFCGD